MMVTSFGQKGYNPGEFNKPADIDIDEQNRLYVVDKGNKRVQIFQVTISNE